MIGTLANSELAGEFFSNLLAKITQDFGWFYMLSVALFLLFIVLVAVSKWGRIKLGPDHAEPEYSFPTWFAISGSLVIDSLASGGISEAFITEAGKECFRARASILLMR